MDVSPAVGVRLHAHKRGQLASGCMPWGVVLMNVWSLAKMPPSLVLKFYTRTFEKVIMWPNVAIPSSVQFLREVISHPVFGLGEKCNPFQCLAFSQGVSLPSVWLLRKVVCGHMFEFGQSAILPNVWLLATVPSHPLFDF